MQTVTKTFEYDDQGRVIKEVTVVQDTPLAPTTVIQFEKAALDRKFIEQISQAVRRLERTTGKKVV